MDFFIAFRPLLCCSFLADTYLRFCYTIQMCKCVDAGRFSTQHNRICRPATAVVHTIIPLQRLAHTSDTNWTILIFGNKKNKEIKWLNQSNWMRRFVQIQYRTRIKVKAIENTYWEFIKRFISVRYIGENKRYAMMMYEEWCMMYDLEGGMDIIYVSIVYNFSITCRNSWKILPFVLICTLVYASDCHFAFICLLFE